MEEWLLTLDLQVVSGQWTSEAASYFVFSQCSDLLFASLPSQSV